MKVDTRFEDDTLVVTVEGRLSLDNAPKLEAAIEPEIGMAQNMVFDFADLVFISSAGLRTILSCQKRMMAKGGAVTVRNANRSVRDIFTVTGFNRSVTVE